MDDKLDLEESIYVCDCCLRACCLQAISMCDQAYHAGMTTRTRGELIGLDKEDIVYLHN